MISPLVYTFLRAVCLPDKLETDFSGQTFTVSGWGTNAHNGSQNNQLHHVQVPSVSDQDCQEGYGADTITEQMMCAGNFSDGGIDSCKGDSGGPLTWVDPDSGKVKLVGVISWGVGW